MDLGLADHVYLITGGSRGLGLATAKVLTSEGAKVVIAARDSDVVDQAVAELGPENCLGLVGDLADPHAAERLVAATVGRFGRIDGGLMSVGGPAPGTAPTRPKRRGQDGAAAVRRPRLLGRRAAGVLPGVGGGFSPQSGGRADHLVPDGRR